MESESAYEIAVNNGFRGTEPEWLASLKGKDGVDGKSIKGDKGSPGDDKRPTFETDITRLLSSAFKGTVEYEFDQMLKSGKITGPQGIQGEQGIQGIPGIQGPKGQDGVAGKDGKSGKDGRNGFDGIDGLKGDKGDPGKDGAEGEPGKSSHQQWLDDGHTGDTEAYHRWLAQKLGVMTGSIFTNTNTGGGSGTVKSVNNVLPNGSGNVAIDIDDIGGVVADQVTITGDGTTGNPLSAVGGGGSGDVVGPAVAFDNAIVRFDGTTGKLIQNGPYTISDAGDVSGLHIDTAGALNILKVNGTSLTAVTGTGAVVLATGSISGNAGTATALQTARTIGAISFDGTANIVPQTIQTVDETTDTSCFPAFFNASGTQTGGQQPKTNTVLTFDSTTNILTTTGFRGAISTNSSATSSNMNAAGTGGNGATSTAVSGYQLNAATTTYYRLVAGGSSNTTLTAGTSYANFMVTQGPVTEAATGSHPLLTQTAIRAPAFTDGAGATTNATTLYIEGAPTGITPTGNLLALWVAGGNSLFAGTITASNYSGSSSGTNTGDQTITLTGDVTGTGTGSFATTIANNAITTAKITNSAVTLAKIQNASTNSVLIGSGVAGSGTAYTEITLGTNLSMSGTTLNAAGGGSGSPGGVSGNIQYNNAGAFGGAGTIDASANMSGIGTIASGAQTITSSSATAFSVGPNGATNPVLQIDGSAGSSNTGVSIKGSTSTSSAVIQSIGTGANIDMGIRAKGTGDAYLLSPSGNSVLLASNNTRLTVSNLFSAWTVGASSAASTVKWLWTGAADAALTAGVNAVAVGFNLNQTRQHASNTAITSQDDILLSSGTHTFVTAGGVITNANFLSITGPASGGTNSTLTNSSAINIASKALTNVTNGYGLNVSAPTGAGTKNLAINATGASELGTVQNTRINTRITTITSSATPTPAGDTTDQFTVTALATGATFAAPTGTPVDGQKLTIRIKDNATAQTLAWNAIYRAGTDVPLPTTTVLSKTMYAGFIYNAADTKWDLVSSVGNI